MTNGVIAAISDDCGPATSRRAFTWSMSLRSNAQLCMDQRRLVGTRRIGIATWRPIDKCAAQLAEAFFGWALSLARISQQIIFKPQAGAHAQHCHLSFLFRFLQCGRRPLV